MTGYTPVQAPYRSTDPPPALHRISWIHSGTGAIPELLKGEKLREAALKELSGLPRKEGMIQ